MVVCDNASRLSALALNRVGNIGIILAQYISAQTDVALDRIDCLCGSERAHVSRGLSHEWRIVDRKMNDRRSQARAVRIRDEDRKTRVHHADERVCCAEIDANDGVHGKN